MEDRKGLELMQAVATLALAAFYQPTPENQFARDIAVDEYRRHVEEKESLLAQAVRDAEGHGHFEHANQIRKHLGHPMRSLAD